MSKFKPGLGRGLDALINQPSGDEKSSISVSTKNLNTDDGKSYDVLFKISVTSIVPNPYQPRKEFDAQALDELKKSILENGLIQPITVRRKHPDKYELISGERRLRACKDIGYKEIPAYIIKVETNEAMLALSLIENIQREKLNPIEVANAYKRLIEECNLSQEEIAQRVGKERSTITNSIRLLKLPIVVQESLAKEEISAGHARAIINIPTEKMQIEILNQIKKHGLSVRKVEALVKEFLTGKEVLEKNKQQKKETPESISQREIENRLRRIFGTKVNCRQKKDGSGQVTIEFYSHDEFERLYELFELLETTYN